MASPQLIFTWDGGRVQTALIPAGVTVVTIRACGGGGGGAGGDAAGSSGRPGYAGGGGCGAILEETAPIEVSGGRDVLTVTLGNGGLGGLGGPFSHSGNPGTSTTVVISNSPDIHSFPGAPGGIAHGGAVHGIPNKFSGGGGQSRSGPWFEGAGVNSNYGYCGGEGGAGIGPSFAGGSGGCNGGSLENPFDPAFYWKVHPGFPGKGWVAGMNNWGAGGGGGDGDDHVRGGDGGQGAPGYTEVWW